MDAIVVNRESERLYRESLDFIEQRGWRRIEPGDGWWWNQDRALLGEYPLGEAFQIELELDGIDTRQPPDLPVRAYDYARLDDAPAFRLGCALVLGASLLAWTVLLAALWWAL